MLVVETVD
jgi:hypothetical protein